MRLVGDLDNFGFARFQFQSAIQFARDNLKIWFFATSDDEAEIVVNAFGGGEGEIEINFAWFVCVIHHAVFAGEADAVS